MEYLGLVALKCMCKEQSLFSLDKPWCLGIQYLNLATMHSKHLEILNHNYNCTSNCYMAVMSLYQLPSHYHLHGYFAWQDR